MSQLFNVNFWFNLRPGRLSENFQTLLIGFIIILAIACVASLILKKNKKNLYFKFWEKILSFSSTNIAIGLLIWFFNHELIPFLSARFWYVLWIALMTTWMVFIVKHTKTIPERKKEIELEKAYKKYIP